MGRDGGSGSTVLVAFALGAIAGAAIALLYAPAPGEEMRRKLAERAREGRSRAEELMREGREFLDRQRRNVADAVEEGREAYNQTHRETL